VEKCGRGKCKAAPWGFVEVVGQDFEHKARIRKREQDRRLKTNICQVKVKKRGFQDDAAYGKGEIHPIYSRMS